MIDIGEAVRAFLELLGIASPVILLVVLIKHNREDNDQRLRKAGLQANDDNREELQRLKASIEDDAARAKRRESTLLDELEEAQGDIRKNTTIAKQAQSDAEALTGRFAALTASNIETTGSNTRLAAEVASLKLSNEALAVKVNDQDALLGKKDMALDAERAAWQVERTAWGVEREGFKKEIADLKQQVADLIADNKKQAEERVLEIDGLHGKIASLTDAVEAISGKGVPNATA